MKQSPAQAAQLGPQFSHLRPVTSVGYRCSAATASPMLCVFAKHSDGPLLGRADSPGIFVCILNQLSIQNRLQLPPRGKQLQDT